MKSAMFAIRSHFTPTGKRLEGVYRFTYERELKDIDCGVPHLRITEENALFLDAAPQNTRGHVHQDSESRARPTNWIVRRR